MTIDADLLVAYVDGELDEANRARVAAAVAVDGALAARVAAHQQLRQRLQAGFGPVVDEPPPERLAAALGPRDNVIDFRLRRSAPGLRRTVQFAAMAAALAIGIVVGPALRPPADISAGNTGLVAGGSLAHALETQSATDGLAHGVRIGLTFRSGDDWCRSFSRRALSGIACRSPGGWQLRRTFGGEDAVGDYRQAAAGPLVEAAQQMATAAPLDPTAERRVIASGWRPAR